MGRGKLFEAWSFRLAQPAPFDDPQYSGAKGVGLSRYNTAGSARKATLHAPTMRALLAYAKLVSACESGAYVEDLGAIGHQDSTYRIAEYCSASKRDCVVFTPNTGKFIVSQFPNGSDTPAPYSVGAGSGSGTALLFCLMPVLEKDDEFRTYFAHFRELMDAGWTEMDDAFETALLLCDNVYRRIENAKGVGKAGVNLAIPTTGNIPTLSRLAIDAGTYTPTGVVYGEFQVVKAGTGVSQSAVAYKAEDFSGHYQLSQRTLSAREESMVPSLPDWYIIPKEVVRVCEHAQITTKTSQPMRNFMFRGEAGTGKTMGAQAIAAGLHLPYTMMTCSANTEISDLIGQFIPDGGSDPGQSEMGELPTISDIVMHPPSVYKMLTGEYDEEKTEDDVLQKLVEIAVGRLAAKEEHHGQRIRYVDSRIMERVMAAIAEKFVCYQYTKEDPAPYGSDRWDLFFWCNSFPHYGCAESVPDRDYSYFTLTFNEKQTAEQHWILRDRLERFLRENFEHNKNLDVVFQHKVSYNIQKIREDAENLKRCLDIIRSVQSSSTSTTMTFSD